MISRLRRSVLVVLLAWLVLPISAEAEMAGGEGRPTPFVGQIEHGDGYCEFSVDVERINFLVTTVANKYRLVRMRIGCSGELSLALSSTDDRLEMLVGDDNAVGVLSLRQSDGALWDAFDPDIRRSLAYPPEIRAGEPVYVFAYFPAEEVGSLPYGFEFTIASLDETVQLVNLATAARN